MKVDAIIAECLAGDVTKMEDLCVQINIIEDEGIKLEHITTAHKAIIASETSGPSLYCLGMMHEFGLIDANDNDETPDELTAEEAVAATKIKEEQRLVEARTCYIEAMEDHNHVPSMIRFASMLARGEGGEHSVDRAIEFYRKVLTQGSEVELAIAKEKILELTPYTTANINKLFSGVLAGKPEAAATLAHRTKTLVGKNKLSELGRNLSRKLRANVDTTTEAGVFTFAKALLHEQSINGQDVDDQHIVEAYRTAIDLNDANAMNRLAKIYLDGEYGIDQDEDAAIELLQRAADAEENPIAAREASQTLVGLFREKGDIINQVKYLKKLCKLGDAEAMFELAGLYVEELSKTNVEIKNRKLSLHKMVELFVAAGSRGIHQAYFELGQVYKSGLPEFQANLGKAIYYYKLAAGKGNNDALAIDFDDLKRVHQQQKEAASLEKGAEPEATMISADIEMLLIVENRRKADKKLNELFLSIDALKTHGDLFPTDNKGKLLARLAKQLEGKLTSFILDLADENTPADKKDLKALDQFKKEFKAIIVENSNELQGHRAKWKPMLANILIALTGVGLVALLGRAAIVGLFSEKKNANTFNKYAFFGETASEALSRKVEKSLDAEVEVLRKAPAAK